MKNTVHKTALALLKRAAALPDPQAFTYRELSGSTGAAAAMAAFEKLLDCDLFERVPVSCGVWYYRLTAAGAGAAKGSAKLVLQGEE